MSTPSTTNSPYQGGNSSFINNQIHQINVEPLLQPALEFPAISFDRLMFTMPLSVVRGFNSQRFLTQVTSTGKPLSYTFDAAKSYRFPYLFRVKLELGREQVMINISSKCLLDRYPEGITRNNIEDVFTLINESGVLQLDVEAALSTAMVVQCDVKEDRRETLSANEISALGLSVVHKNWQVQKYPKGITFIKVSRSFRPTGVSLTLYLKGDQMSTGQTEFLKAVVNPAVLLKSFEGIVRYELKANNARSVRQVLGISDLKLLTVLNANGSPIEKVMNKILSREIQQGSRQLLDDAETVAAATGKRAINDFKNYLLCQHCEFDLATLRVLLGKMMSPRTNITAALKPYRKIINDRAALALERSSRRKRGIS